MSWDFLHPGRLWLLLLLVPLVAAIAAGAIERKRRAVRFTNVDLLDRIVPRRPMWRRHVVTGLVFLGFVVGVLGLAQPYREERVADERSIIMLALDVSLSMMADDVSPSRLDAAKEQAKAFVDGVDPSIDIGLVSFSKNVKLKVDPTLDRSKVLDAIDRLQLEEGTAIGDAIIATTETIVSEFGAEPIDQQTDTTDGGGTDGNTPLGDGAPPAAVVILTDGETIEGLTTGPEGAAEAAKFGIPVYGIAFGTPEGSIVLQDPDTGAPVVQPVPVQYDELTQAAEITGGKFYAAESEGDLGDVYADIESQLEPRLEVPEPERVELTIRYLSVALFLLAVAFAASQLLLGGLA